MKRTTNIILISIIVICLITIFISINTQKEIPNKENIINIIKIDNSSYQKIVYQEPTPLKVTNEIDEFPNSNKLHYSHMPLIYKFNGTRCQRTRYDSLMYAFNEITSETNGSVSFVEGDYNDKPDLIINCFQYSGETTYNEEGSSEILGEGSNWYQGNIILNGTINLYSSISSSGYFPFVEIHEILHTFGYNHSDKISSLMYPIANEHSKWAYERKNDLGINITIDKDIIDDLQNVYKD